MEYGDSLLVVGDNSTVKVHIHSNHPGLVLRSASSGARRQKSRSTIWTSRIARQPIRPSSPLG